MTLFQVRMNTSRAEKANTFEFFVWSVGVTLLGIIADLVMGADQGIGNVHRVRPIVLGLFIKKATDFGKVGSKG